MIRRFLRLNFNIHLPKLHERRRYLKPLLWTLAILGLFTLLLVNLDMDMPCSADQRAYDRSCGPPL